MNNEKKIKFDNAILRRAADGTIIITSRKSAGCVNIGLLVVTALVAIGMGVSTLMGVFQFVIRRNEINGGGLIFGVFVTLMFGCYAYYLFSRMRSGGGGKEISFLPIMRVVKIGERVIPYSEIADIAAKRNPVPMMEDMDTVKFILYINPDEQVELGSRAMNSRDPEKIEKFIQEAADIFEQAVRLQRKGSG